MPLLHRLVSLLALCVAHVLCCHTLLHAQKYPQLRLHTDTSLFRSCCGQYADLRYYPAHDNGNTSARDTMRFPDKEFAQSLVGFAQYAEAYRPINFDSVFCPPPPVNSSAQTLAEIALLKQYTSRLLSGTQQSQRDSVRCREIAQQGSFIALPKSRDTARIILVIPSLLYIVRGALNVDSVLYKKLTREDTADIRRGGAILVGYDEKYPQTFRWLAALAREGAAYSFGWKSRYMRPRPYQLDTTVQTLERPPHASYPSNHSIFGFLMAKAWMSIVPATLHADIQRSADEYGFSREIMGIHYPSDTQASKIIVENLWRYLQSSPEFLRDMKAAQAEWR